MMTTESDPKRKTFWILIIAGIFIILFDNIVVTNLINDEHNVKNNQKLQRHFNREHDGYEMN